MVPETTLEQCRNYENAPQQKEDFAEVQAQPHPAFDLQPRWRKDDYEVSNVVFPSQFSP
jgi:hypothetical protein